MIPFLLFAADLAGSDILVTAALDPVAAAAAPVSATGFDAERIVTLGLPLVTDLARLAPGVSVSSSGPRGAQTQLRIRGAEANHTLLFADGIAINDPASGNEARFEQLLADGLGRFELVSGPQSALWGSEAIGGVIALESPDPLGATRLAATGEAGSGLRRGSATIVAGGDTAGITATVAGLRDRGIDILGGGTGDRDSVRNRTASIKAVARPGSDGEFGLAARYIHADSAFDGSDPVTFLRADTADASRSQLIALRGWARVGLAADAPLSGQIDGQFVSSRIRNRLATAPVNRSSGERLRIGGQGSVRHAGHALTLRAEHEEEDFATSDVQYGGATDQRRSRARTALVGQLSSAWTSALSTDLAIRHDRFNRFADATTVRAAALWRPVASLRLHAAYGQGIAQPTFYDLYGFFPGSFVGNPALKPERSRGYEVGVSWTGPVVTLGVTGFHNRLRDEIVGTFDPATFLSSTANSAGRSRRQGIEARIAVRPLPALEIEANATWLDANERTAATGLPLREVRRPRHSANLIADWRSGAFSAGATLSYVGTRRDTDFDAFPAQTVILGDYMLASLRLGWRLTDAIEAFARGENLGDARYQDVVGYRTRGRSITGGIRLAFGD